MRFLRNTISSADSYRISFPAALRFLYVFTIGPFLVLIALNSIVFFFYRKINRSIIIDSAFVFSFNRFAQFFLFILKISVFESFFCQFIIQTSIPRNTRFFFQLCINRSLLFEFAIKKIFAPLFSFREIRNSFQTNHYSNVFAHRFLEP